MYILTKHNKWYKLDNAAKIFPPTTSSSNPKIFRFSILLKEEIEPTNLQKALDITIEDFPIFKSILKKGLFWYYLEESITKPKVKEETTSPCEKLNTPLLFEVTYFKNKINLEVYHALSDGAGCLTFFENLIYNYLKIYYNIQDNTIITKSSEYEKEVDSFNHYYNPKAKIKLKNRKKAYNLKGKWYPEGKIKIISASTSTSKLKEIAKNCQTTITGLLISLTIKSLEDILSIKEKKKEISITVPINLRKIFKSETVRNFFSVTNITYKFTNQNTPLEEIIKEVDKQLKRSLNKDVIYTNMTKMIWLENFFVIRLVPLFIKNKILNFFYKETMKKQTLGLSNVGIFKLPKSCFPYIDNVLVMNSTDAIEICVISYEDTISISCSSHFTNSELEKNLFRMLRKFNLDITIYTNDLERDD